MLMPLCTDLITGEFCKSEVSFVVSLTIRILSHSDGDAASK
jgi:hypothetical protein